MNDITFQRIDVFLQSILLWIAAFLCLLFIVVFLLKYSQMKRDGLDFCFARSRASGVIFGKRMSLFKYVVSREEREGHICCMGPSGAGKTSALLIPTLRGWKGTSFSIDIAGDIEKNVHLDNKLVFEPENANSAPYNVFYAIDRLVGESERNEALEKLAFLLMPELTPQESSASAKFYNQEGRKILTAALLAGYGQGKDFVEICKWIMSSSYQQLFHDIDQSKNSLAIQYINSFAGALPENTSGCKQSADLAIKLFATNDNVMRSIHRSGEYELSFNPQTIESYNVFFVISDNKLDVYAPLVHLIVAQVLEYFSTRSNHETHSILLCLDELASFGKLELVSALRKLRKKRIRILVATQSINDLYMIYGHVETKAMLGNFAYKVLLGASDYESQEYWTKSIGKRDSIRKSIQKKVRVDNVTQTEVREYAFEPAELSRLRQSLILLYPGGYMKLRKNYYFKKR